MTQKFKERQTINILYYTQRSVSLPFLLLTFRINPTRESRLLIFSTTRGSNTRGRASKCSDPHEVGAAAVEEEEECDDEEEDLGG